MLRWGLALMVVGGLSFVLPLFDRQFILVSAIGVVSGAGSVVVGILLFAIGIALLAAESKMEQQKNSAFLSANDNIRQPITPSPSNAPSLGNERIPQLAQNSAPSDVGDAVTATVSAIKQFAERGDPEAQNNLGMMYIKGENLPKDEVAGLKWLRRSAGQDFLRAEIALGNLYLAGSPHRTQDYNLAMVWYFKAVNHAASELDATNRRALGAAIAGLGFIYAMGRGLPKRTDEVINLLSANTQGVPIPYYLGYIYAEGRYGQRADKGKAATWLSVMIENDIRNSDDLSSGCAHRIEAEYSDGEGRPLDFSGPIRFLIKASSEGVAEAQYAMGVAHWKGWRGLQLNKRRAVQLLEYAAAQGEPRATRLLPQLIG